MPTLITVLFICWLVWLALKLTAKTASLLVSR